MQNVLEQGPDFWCWFDKTQFSCHCVHAIHACKDVFNQMLLYTFQSNCAEGLHFSAFHLLCYTDTSIEESMVSDREDAVHSHVSDTSPLPSERSPETSSIFE